MPSAIAATTELHNDLPFAPLRFRGRYSRHHRWPNKRAKYFDLAWVNNDDKCIGIKYRAFLEKIYLETVVGGALQTVSRRETPAFCTEFYSLLRQHKRLQLFR